MMLIHFAVLPFVLTQGIVISDFFQKTDTCNVNSALILETTSVFSNVQCALLCLESDSCRSYSVELSMPGVCYLNADTLNETGCASQGMKHFNSKSALKNPCLHDGIFNATEESCRCFHGYVGNRCERLMYDCSEGKDSGHYTDMNDIFNIHPPTSPTPFTVWCRMHYYGQTVVMLKDPSLPYVDFNRTWDEYKRGFGDMAAGGNFWLGNERLYYVTNHRPMTLVLQIGLDQEPSLSWNYKQQFYLEFKISSEADGFKCNYQNSYPNTWDGGIHVLEDCLADQKMMPFSTIDVDNDNDGGSCAEVHLSGWWYSDCGGCNPTGRLQPMSDIYQSSDPAFISIPVNNSWAPRRVDMFVEYYG